MSYHLLLGGVALCVLSVILAIVQILRTQPPRAAAIVLIIGIAVIFAASYLAPQPFGPGLISEAWAHVTGTATTTP